MSRKNLKLGSVDAYIAGFPEEVQGILHRLRETIKAIAPQAEETIRYQIPTFVLHENLVHFAAYTKHIGLYPTPSAIAAFREQLREYKFAKGSVQFPLHKPIPWALIEQIIEFRVQEVQCKSADKETLAGKVGR